MAPFMSYWTRHSTLRKQHGGDQANYRVREPLPSCSEHNKAVHDPKFSANIFEIQIKFKILYLWSPQQWNFWIFWLCHWQQLRQLKDQVVEVECPQEVVSPTEMEITTGYPIAQTLEYWSPQRMLWRHLEHIVEHQLDYQHSAFLHCFPLWYRIT